MFFTQFPFPLDTKEVALALHREPGFVWLDSASSGSFSLLAFAPRQMVTFRDAKDQEAFRRFLRTFPTTDGDWPKELSHLHFTGGWIGYVAYEAYLYSEAVPISPSHLPQEPLAQFCEYDSFVYFDHVRRAATFVSRRPEGRALYQTLLARLQNPAPVPSFFSTTPPVLKVSQARYAHDFTAIQHALRDGSFFELNYTIDFTAPYSGDSFALYLKLRELAPAPLMSFFRFPEFEILSASPELFFTCFRDALVTQPIKGTIRRDKDLHLDAQQQNILLNSAKDRAELLMVTDMLRNDVGRLARPGGVTVPAVARVESFTHYHHLVSDIHATLRPGLSLYDIFVALFPGGSITGAPKIEVMRHLDKLEDRARGVYTGAIGFMSRHGLVEFNLPIRTLVASDQQLCFATGGGIVADSVLNEEFAECLLKAAGLYQALGHALPPGFAYGGLSC